MGMSRKVALILAVLVLGNVVLLLANQRYADAVAEAQLKQAMEAKPVVKEESAPTTPKTLASKPVPKVAQAKSLPPKSTQTVKTVPRQNGQPVVSSKSEILVCKLFGPYERAYVASEVVNRLQLAGAEVDLLPSTDQNLRNFLENAGVDAVIWQKSHYWVKAKQAGFLQGSKPQEASVAYSCDKMV